MKREEEHVPIAIEPQELGAEQRRPVQRERLADERRASRQDVPGPDRFRQVRQIADGRARPHVLRALDRRAVGGVERRPHRFVPIDDGLEGILKCLDIERAGQHHVDRGVVQAAAGVELALRPHLVLVERQRVLGALRGSPKRERVRRAIGAVGGAAALPQPHRRFGIDVCVSHPDSLGATAAGGCRCPPPWPVRTAGPRRQYR